MPSYRLKASSLGRTERKLVSSLLIRGSAMVLTLMLAVIIAPSASAHTALTASTPADQSKTTAPSQLELRFNENVNSRFVVVLLTAAGGQRVDTAEPHVSGATVTVKVLSTPPAGTYTVAYRVVSADGHPVTGTFGFEIVAGAGTPPTTSATIPSTPPAAPAAADETEPALSLQWALIASTIVVAVALTIGLVFRRQRKGRHTS